MAVGLGEDDRLCLLVVIGVREDGEKELLAVEDGYRESADSWAAVFRDLRDRGMNEPKLVTGDGALGAWAALREVFLGAESNAVGSTRQRTHWTRCPSGFSPARRACCTRWPRPPARRTPQGAGAVRSEFDAKYRKAVAKLNKDWNALTAFFDFPPSTGGTYGRRTRSRAASRP